MRKTIGILIALIAILGGGYLGLVILLAQPLMAAAQAYDMGMLTATLLTPIIIKVLLAVPVGGTIGYIGIAIGAIIATD